MTPTALWTRWTLACAAGEIIGIGLAGGAAAVVLVGGEPVTPVERWGVFALLVGSGALEGLALGGFQWLVLRRAIRTVPAQAWIGATVAIAVAGWAIGMLPSTLATPEGESVAFDPPLALLGLGAAAGGAVAGLAFGWAQWAVLRHHASKAGRWIWANALGWGLAMTWIYLAASLPTADSPAGVVALAGVAGGLLSGLSMGAVTGWALLRIADVKPNRPSA